MHRVERTLEFLVRLGSGCVCILCMRKKMHAKLYRVVILKVGVFFLSIMLSLGRKRRLHTCI